MKIIDQQLSRQTEEGGDPPDKVFISCWRKWRHVFYCGLRLGQRTRWKSHGQWDPTEKGDWMTTGNRPLGPGEYFLKKGRKLKKWTFHTMYFFRELLRAGGKSWFRSQCVVIHSTFVNSVSTTCFSALAKGLALSPLSVTSCEGIPQCPAWWLCCQTTNNWRWRFGSKILRSSVEVPQITFSRWHLELACGSLVAKQGRKYFLGWGGRGN